MLYNTECFVLQALVWFQWGSSTWTQHHTPMCGLVCANAVLLCCGSTVTISGEKDSLCLTSTNDKDYTVIITITLCSDGESFWGYRLSFPAFAGTTWWESFVRHSDSTPVPVVLF